MGLDMIQWLNQWLQTDDTKIIYLLTLIFIANLFDFLIGWLKAKFKQDVNFSSSKAIFGIARKLVLFMIAVFFIPVSLLLPNGIGVGIYIVFLLGYLLTEINSILSHFKLTEDDKSTDIFIEFINKIFNKGDSQK